MPVPSCFLKGVLPNRRDGEEEMEGHGGRGLEREQIIFLKLFLHSDVFIREPI